MTETDAFTPMPDTELARRLAGPLEPYRFLLTRWQWAERENRLICSLGFVGGESLLVVADPAQERLILDVWVGTVPCMLEALLALLAVNFDAPFKTRVAEHDGSVAVVCLENLLPLEYGLTKLRTLVQEALAAGAQRRGALGALWHRLEPTKEGLTA